ncbi:hypothetical protein [Chryseobacterium koreense]|uniref:hypothetical protein n=1 Tax=Chryseobacterium koreense TaxID=232216 RepID=UPI00069DC19B|nr:hypothetical protein [Chryseobacterium koreense]MBB5333484.1 Tfp pilus assembly major pilin PilA [Chryseobacterium koreense]
MMYQPIIITAFGLLTLATCANPDAKNENTSKETSVNATTTSTVAEHSTTSANATNDKVNPSINTTMQDQTSSPKKGEPEMAPGLPPDKEALDQAKKEAALRSAKSDKGGVIYLKEGENRFLKEYEMNVTFKKMLEDSRCPQGVDCIWAGNATAEIELMGTYTRPMTFQLSTTNDARRGTTTTGNFNGYSISLVEVYPQTTAEKGFKARQGNYKIGLKFSKSSNGDGVTTK